MAHVGYYLIDHGRSVLEQNAVTRLSLWTRASRIVGHFPLLAYLFGVLLITALVTTQAEAFPPNAGNSVFQLGKGDFYGNNGLDEVALYGTALSAARVAAHFAAGT